MVTAKTIARMTGADAETDRTLDLDALYRRHGATVSRWVKRLWGPSDAQDVLQEVFLVVHRRLPEFRGESAITTWLYSITVRVVVDRRRKEKWRRLLWRRAQSELSSAQGHADTPLGTALREQAARAVYAILDTMSERDRTLLILFELESLSAQNIAEVLGISESNVWVALHRARGRFRKAYCKRFGEAEMGVGDAEEA